MNNSQPVGPGRLKRASAALLVALSIGVLGLTAGCGGDDSKPKESRAELEAELSKLSKFHQDDFRAGDTNHDLRLQDTELDAMLEEDFKSLDLNHDGEINGDDIRMADAKHGPVNDQSGEKAELDVDASLAFIDLNKDGRVPIEEYAEHVERHFMVQMDTNKDGHLDPSEMVSFYRSEKLLEAK